MMGREFPPFITAWIFKGHVNCRVLLDERPDAGSAVVDEETMTKKSILFAYDKIIAFTQLVFFLWLSWSATSPPGVSLTSASP